MGSLALNANTAGVAGAITDPEPSGCMLETNLKKKKKTQDFPPVKMSTPKWIRSHKPFLLVEHYQPLDLGWNRVALPSIHKIQLSAVWFSDSNSFVGEKCNHWVHCWETLTPENRGASSGQLIKLQTYFPSAWGVNWEIRTLGEHGEIKHLNNHHRQHRKKNKKEQKRVLFPAC